MINIEPNKEIVIKSTGCKVDICQRDIITNEIEYLYTDIESIDWLVALIRDCIE